MVLARNFPVRVLSAVAVVAAVCVATSAAAVTQPMVGTYNVKNPSVPFPFSSEVEQRQGAASVSGTGTNDPAVVGNKVVVPANGLSQVGAQQIRHFAPFPSVAQLTFTYTSTHLTATFGANLGAAGSGPLEWCPPVGNTPPAPTGGVNCSIFTAVGTGERAARIDIQPGVNAFGGALRMNRKNVGQVWFNAVGANPVSAFVQTNDITQPWSVGLTNYEYVPDVNPPADIYQASLSASGRVTNIISGPVGTLPGGTLEAWGFKFTTGTVAGSDVFPPVATCGGTTTSPGVGCFFFSTAGSDNAVGSGRNIVMVAGAIAFSPGGQGNLFHRVSNLQMVVPEPSTALGAVAGLAALVGLARVRRNG